MVIADISVSPKLRHPIGLVGDGDKYVSLFHGKQIIIDNRYWNADMLTSLTAMTSLTS